MMLIETYDVCLNGTGEVERSSNEIDENEFVEMTR